MATPNWTIKQIVDSIRGKEILDHVENEYKISSFEQLNQEKVHIKYDLSQFINEVDSKHLYHAYKINLVFKSQQLAWRACISGLKAAMKLQKTFKGFLQTIISDNLEQIKSNINECKELEGIWKFSEAIHFMSKYISSLYISILKKSIDDSLNSIYSLGDKDTLKRSLKFLSEVKTERKSELIKVIISVSFSSLDWIKNQKKSLRALRDPKILKMFEDDSWELIDLIDLIPINSKNLQENVNTVKQMLPKRKVDNISISRNGNELMNESKIDFLSDDKKLLSERVEKIAKIYETSDYMGEKIMVSIWKGFLDSNVPICIKCYYHKAKIPCEHFKADLLLTKYLNEKHNLFLKYIGWTFEDAIQYKDGIYFRYSIVTEDFESTLIDDIITRNQNNQKYSYNEFSNIVKILLEGFSFLESKKILHHNLKPHNILIIQNGNIKIAGFNASRIYTPNDDLSYSNNNKWHDLYIAPEIFLKNKTEKKFDSSFAKNADVYSLGLIFMQIYSLLPIEELNTPYYYGKIDNYVSLFKPKNVANLLKGMLAIDSTQRVSFKDSLSSFISEEERRNREMQVKIEEPIKSSNLIESHLINFLRIEASLLRIQEDICSEVRTLSDEVSLEFKKGFYNERQVLIRTFRHQDENKLLPYIEEARLLQFLAGKHSIFMDYYGLIYDSSQPGSLSLITELCNCSLMSDITHRQKRKIYFVESDLKNYIELLLKGFAILKQFNIDHKNIKPHNILFDAENKLKITGFAVSNTEIISICKFPENERDFLQTEEGYSSPELIEYNGRSQIDFEKSDIYSLGLTIWQMCTLCHTSGFTYGGLSCIQPEWIYFILPWMLRQGPNKRKNFASLHKILTSF